MESISNPRWDSFDTIKGIACIGVVFIHVLFPEPLKDTVKCMARFSVPVFFLTSGFFFSKDGRTCSAGKTGEKVRHIMLLILNAALFFTLFQLVFKPLEDPNWRPLKYLAERATAGKLVKLFITNDPLAFGHLWFLLALLYIYLFCLLFFGNGKRLGGAGLIGCALLVGYMLLQEFTGVLYAMHLRSFIHIPESDQSLFYANLFVFRGLSFFLIGIALRRNEQQICSRRCPKPLFLSLFVFFLAVTAWEWTKTNNYTQYYVNSILAAFTLMIFAIQWSTLKPRFLHYLGRKLSLYIYIFHIPVQKSLNLFFRKQHISNSPLILWTMPFLVLAATILISFLFFQARRLIRRFYPKAFPFPSTFG